jgi:hypothetical protein
MWRVQPEESADKRDGPASDKEVKRRLDTFPKNSEMDFYHIAMDQDRCF